MEKRILLIIIAIIIQSNGIFSQFTKSQVEELTAKGISAALEPDNSFVLEKAEALTTDYSQSDYIYSVCALFNFMYRNWNYAPDPGGMEYFENAGVSVFNMTGDCDDYAILMVSLIKSLGGDGRIICVSGHAYPEVYLGKNLTKADMNLLEDEINDYYEQRGSRTRVRNLNYHRDYDDTVWLNLDYQDRYPGGSFVEYSPRAEHLVIYSDGSYRLAYLNSEN